MDRPEFRLIALTSMTRQSSNWGSLHALSSFALKRACIIGFTSPHITSHVRIQHHTFYKGGLLSGYHMNSPATLTIATM